MKTWVSKQPAWSSALNPAHNLFSPKIITSRINQTRFISRAQSNNPSAKPNSDTKVDAETPIITSRRDALSTALTGSISLAAAATGGGFVFSTLPAEASSTPPSITEAREAKMVMRVAALRGSVPASWVQDFSTALEGYGIVALTQKPQIADIWQDLKGEAANASKKKKNRKQPKPTTVDTVTLGDAWLAAAISQNLIQPIQGAKELRYWTSLSPRWKQLVCRTPTGACDPAGDVYAIPYRFGCTTLLYRKDTAARWGGSPSATISDWDDLLLPGLKGRVAFIDSPRELVGVALKTLGLPYRATASDLISCGLSRQDLIERVKKIVGQIKVFSNVDHVRAMSAGEVDVVVGWSDDLVPLAERAATAELIVPLSGTALWSDTWCVPTAAAGGAEDGSPSPLLPAWLELGLQPSRVRKSLRGGASPLVLPAVDKNFEKKGCFPLRPGKFSSENAALGDMLFPSDAVLSRSEFLLPLDANTAAMYREVLEAAAAV
jgi:spermidine/putrescine-binding protein